MGLSRRYLRKLVSIPEYLLDVLFIPMVSLLIFLYYLNDLSLFFAGSNAKGKHSHGQSAYDMRSKGDDRGLYNQHSTYVTDDYTDFLVSAAPCDVPSEDSGHNGSKVTKYDGLFLVSTAAVNLNNRRILRHLYNVYNNTRPFKVKAVFLVGRPSDLIIQANLERENYQYRDIVQGNFIDHYFNLTYKTIMGYRWARLHCRDVRIILKMDDDVYLDVFKFFDYFLPIIPRRRRMIYGFLNYHPRVFREGKYKVAVEEYSEKQYPNFCSGFFVIPTLDVIDELYEVSKTVKFFRLEDVFTYGMVREHMVDVQLVHLDLVTYQWQEYVDCVKDQKYRCKYMGVEAPVGELLTCYDQVMEFRRQLGLPGGSQ